MLDAPVGSLVMGRGCVGGWGVQVQVGGRRAKGTPQAYPESPSPWHVSDSLLSKQISTAFIELYN